MKRKQHLLTITFCFALFTQSAYSQVTSATARSAASMIDSLRSIGYIFRERRKSPEISLTREQAIRFLQQRAKSRYWADPNDPLRSALNQLVFESSHVRFDSVECYLRSFPYDSISVPWDKFYIWEPLRLKIPVARIPDVPVVADTVPVNDTLARPALPADTSFRAENAMILKDTTIMVIIDTLDNVNAPSAAIPAPYFDQPFQGDSLQVAVRSLLDYVSQRDSMVINFTGASGTKIPVWVGSRKNEIMRYWLRNEFSDSVTVWIGCEGKNTISLYLERGINFRKPARQENYSEAKINVQAVDKTNLHKQNIVLKKIYWKYRTESSLVFSQSTLSNWVKGGENSVSTAIDVTQYADFNRPELKLSSNNFARLKLGFLKSGSEDIRKNLDLLETNSKLNHKAFGKFDFSAILLFKTQIAVGKQYKKVNDVETSEVVSKFFNPAILTIGIGLDYKPNKETSFNLSPLSYKGTFVPAAGKIRADSLTPGKLDQTRYGIPLGKQALNEPGASLMINKISHPYKDLTVTNRIQLFTNYIHNPLNIDIDWEVIADYSLNWFTNLRLNAHLIYDDDTKTPVLRHGVPLKLEDGTIKKTSRIQFKEMFGVSLVFRF